MIALLPSMLGALAGVSAGLTVHPIVAQTIGPDPSILQYGATGVLSLITGTLIWSVATNRMVSRDYDKVIEDAREREAKLIAALEVLTAVVERGERREAAYIELVNRLITGSAAAGGGR